MPQTGGEFTVSSESISTSQEIEASSESSSEEESSDISGQSKVSMEEILDEFNELERLTELGYTEEKINEIMAIKTRVEAMSTEQLKAEIARMEAELQKYLDEMGLTREKPV